MSTMTFRARNNATALELVERRFGGDALILSTVYVDGHVEITATDEAPPPANSDRGFPKRSRRIDMVLDDDVTLEPPAESPAAAQEKDETGDEPAPSQSDTDGGLPSFLRRPAPQAFAEVLDEAKQRPAATDAPKPAAPPAPAPVMSTDRSTAQMRTELLAASRIVLVGPCGAGKTQVALQLALMCQAQSEDAQTGFVFCGTGSRADGAVLAQKSHLLGMKTTFKKPADLNAPTEGETEIVLLSGRVSDAVEQARGLLGAPDTRTLLVLPDGLRAERISRLAAQWRDITTWTTIGHVEAADRPEAEAAVSAEDGLDLLWLSDPDVLIDGLSPAGPDETPAPVSSPPGAEISSTSDQIMPTVMFRSHQTKPEVRP